MPDLLKSNIKTGSILATFAVLLGWAWTLNEKSNRAAASEARVEGQLEALKATTGDHELRIRTMESGMAEIRADVKWIRQQMEQQARRP